MLFAGPDGKKGPLAPNPKVPKTEMSFVTINVKDKKKTEEIALKWTDVYVLAAFNF